MFEKMSAWKLKYGVAVYVERVEKTGTEKKHFEGNRLY